MSARRQFKKVKDVITEADMFTEPIQFTFDGGKTEYKTFTGAISTIIYLSCILAYALHKLIKMSTFVDANVTSSVLPDHFNDEFYYDAGFDTFAFGITEFLNSEPLNEDFGSITVKYEQWDADEDIFIDLKTRPCTFSDFGLNSNSTASANQTFFPPLEKK